LSAPVFLITPPFTQLNTPYPATAYLKGFLNTKNIPSFQADLGIEVTLALFSKQGLQKLFAAINATQELPANIRRIITLQQHYVNTIDAVILFLQGHNPSLAPLIAKRNYLPEAARFDQAEDLQWAFGAMGTQDRAKHLATLYLEDLSDLIKETVDEHFGFSRYAERLGRSARDFDALHEQLKAAPTFTDEVLLDILEKHITVVQPKLVCFSVPFPGNLYSALRCARWIKANHPQIKIAMGGGFANTELRQVKDPRVFELVDFITLDDGEAPIEQLTGLVEGKKTISDLKRTLLLQDSVVTYINNSACADYKQGQVGTPDYGDLLLDKYISAIEVANPMHSLWSDGRWNKLTMAHGCYWGKCTFCDISLDYIQRYEPLTASLLCDRMEELMRQTGHNGFHFVDEAAPPALMRALALEIVKRKLVVSWWANIRFEKSFTRDLCLLLKASGCIAVSGGLEVASDRLLALIEKGITVAQVAKVTQHFTEAGIMVHAYLMYGFPTQTVQETIDSLEMVRQLFAAGVLQSAFWHLFTMTVHSPVGMNPQKYKVKILTPTVGDFANNDLEHEDPTGADHEQFSYGLKKSLHNYMQGACLDWPLQKWFNFKVPPTTVAPNYIAEVLSELQYQPAKSNTKVVWLGATPQINIVTKTKKGQQWTQWELVLEGLRETLTIRVAEDAGRWLAALLEKIHINQSTPYTLEMVKADYEAAGLEDFELFWENKPVNTLYRAGLVQV
jgi:hypothetical protein